MRIRCLIAALMVSIMTVGAGAPSGAASPPSYSVATPYTTYFDHLCGDSQPLGPQPADGESTASADCSWKGSASTSLGDLEAHLSVRSKSVIVGDPTTRDSGHIEPGVLIEDSNPHTVKVLSYSIGVHVDRASASVVPVGSGSAEVYLRSWADVPGCPWCDAVSDDFTVVRSEGAAATADGVDYVLQWRIASPDGRRFRPGRVTIHVGVIALGGGTAGSTATVDALAHVTGVTATIASS